MTRTEYIRFASFAAVTVLITGCARPVFPPQIMDQVDSKISFSDLSRDPGSYKGKWVMLAGVIVRSRTEKDGSTYVEVIQTPADSRGKPLRTDETGGRFIAVSRQFLDPAVYRGGRVITVVGDVIGDTIKPLGETAYRYPLLGVQALRLWEPSYGPRYQIGVGVGVFHRF
jgi:outer membrane lipoprotein